MRQARLTTACAVIVALACGGRTETEEYGPSARNIGLDDTSAYRRDRGDDNNTNGNGATGSGATGSGATGSGATGSGATGSGATGSGATGSGATGSGGVPGFGGQPPGGGQTGVGGFAGGFEPPPPPPPLCEPATPIFDGQSVQGFLANGIGSFQSPCGGAGLEQHYEFVAPYAGVFSFDTLGSNFDTVLSVLETDCLGLELGCNDDWDGVSSLLEVPLDQGQQVTLRVDAFGETGGSYTLTARGPGDLACIATDLNTQLGAGVYSGSLGDEAYAEAGACGGAGPTFAAHWTAPFEGPFLFDTIGSTFDTLLDVKQSCSSESLGCNDDFADLASGVQIYLFTGQSVVVLLQAYSGTAEPGNDHYQLNIQAQ